MDDPVNFNYEDTDSYQNEISELYSYSEESEFLSNRNAFEESMEDCGLPLTWKHMVSEQQYRAINYLMTTLEVSCRTTRIKSCRALAYLIQGNFGECLSLEEQANNSKENVFLLYQQGIFQAFVQQLLIESNLNSKESPQYQPGVHTTQIYNDSSELRLVLSVLCTITETMYNAKDSTEVKTIEVRNQFISELQHPIGDELLTVTLFQMLNNFCSGLAPHYPVKKITLLLWKIILITLGGSSELRSLKERKRKLCKLNPLPDDTMEVTKNMSPCVAIMPDGQARSRTTLLVTKMANKRKVFKQTAFDDAVFAYAKECLLNSLAELNQNEEDGELENRSSGRYCHSDRIADELNDSSENTNNDENSSSNIDLCNLDESLNTSMIDAKSDEGSSSSESGIANDSDNQTSPPEKKPTDIITIEDIDNDNENDHEDNDNENELDIETYPEDRDRVSPPSTSSVRAESRSDVSNLYRGLPWTPKVRKADLIQHLSNIRQKFLGYTLPNDLETTFGLPDPIIEGINVLRKHLYRSLSEVQLEREEAMEKYPLTHEEIDPNYREEPAEKLYAALLPRLPQYMIALLKILLAASTSAKNKPERAESINIMAEINPDVSSQSIIQTMKMNADANRHKETIIKSISAILVLLLKHFKINHVYQFEYVSQQLMFANCIPLILKFLSQDIYSYIFHSKSSISAIDFPACVIGEQPELTTEAIELYSFQAYSWRNMFSCINLLKVLNKLTKWKHSRIMMLVVFKSAGTLLKALNVRHPMLQLYALKLLKVQLKFLGRQWKKNNMKLISPIYQKVRHRLTDDWAYSNDNEARPWDFQAEEFTLQANINKFHQRRYHELLNPNSGRAHSGLASLDDHADEDYDFDASDFNDLSPNFERNYERWLESEVFQRCIDWDKLLSDA